MPKMATGVGDSRAAVGEAGVTATAVRDGGKAARAERAMREKERAMWEMGWEWGRATLVQKRCAFGAGLCAARSGVYLLVGT